MRLRIFAVVSLAAVLTCTSGVWARSIPQEVVECTGWHALCSFADDCKVVSGDTANCDCWKVDENHFVMTSNIKNEVLKARTRTACTSDRPCAVDEAPICRVIQDGDYVIGHEKYEWVSTYSYRGWCENWDPARCDAAPWVDCMTSPCTESNANPDRPLNCQCTINTTRFVGTKGTCTTAPGEVMSTIPWYAWSFRENQFTFAMPTYEYVKSACARLRSDRDR
jgi:hypothetical protein